MVEILKGMSSVGRVGEGIWARAKPGARPEASVSECKVGETVSAVSSVLLLIAPVSVYCSISTSYLSLSCSYMS